MRISSALFAVRRSPKLRERSSRFLLTTSFKGVKELLHQGNVTRIIVKDVNGKVLLEIPATVGIIGAVIAPWLAALGVIAALATKCRIVVERRE
jgi:hypothetical protein